ncbi:MAG: lactonase family protein [Lachnospiraceae bacterium]|nr:lactonase family protein [Lachnospiraceae bacterium]
MAKNSYVAYVSSYTVGSGTDYGIRVYDVDVKKGRMSEKEAVRITNSSYITISRSRKNLYSITDAGLESYSIGEDGSLSFLNEASIHGMRGCYLSCSRDDKYLFCAGYHDAKITVLSLKKSGAIGEITDEVYHKGLGMTAGRNFLPHVQCVKMTRDNKFLLACDLGMDRIIVYRFNHETGKLKEIDAIHSDQESAPRHMQFSKDGKYLYVVHEQSCQIGVYEYKLGKDDMPEFEEIQMISTTNEKDIHGNVASALTKSQDYKYFISSNVGENTVSVFTADQKTGLLTMNLCLPVAGQYPKDAILFPDNKHLVSLNHESNSMTFFAVDMEKGTLIMNGPEIKVDQPNCIIFHELGRA